MSRWFSAGGRWLASTCVLMVFVATTGAGAAGPSATMSPDKDLHDGSIATISGSGFPPFKNIEILQCRGTMGSLPKDLTYCDGFTADTTPYTDASGRFADAPGSGIGGPSGYRVWVLPTPRQRGVEIDCGPRNPCVLYVGVNFEDFRQPKTFLPINYAGTPGQSTGGGSSALPFAVVIAVVVVAGAGAALAITRRRH